MNARPHHTPPAGALTRRSALLAGGCSAALALTGCGGGDSALEVPYITFFFQGVVTDAGGNELVVTLNLNITDAYTGKATGAYDTPTISLTNPVGNTFKSFDASGAFSGSSLTLNVPTATAPLATAYQGEFVEPDTIVLTPQPSGPPVIRLVRVDNSFRPALDASTWEGTDANKNPWTIHFFTDPQFSKEPTEFLTGDDVLGGQANGAITGYATMRRLEITITRGAAAPVALSGRFGPSGTTPPNDKFDAATTLTFSDGSTLKRTSTPPDLP